MPILTLKEQCINCQRFNIIQPAMQATADWIYFYDNRGLQQALGTKTPAAVELAT